MDDPSRDHPTRSRTRRHTLVALVAGALAAFGLVYVAEIGPGVAGAAENAPVELNGPSSALEQADRLALVELPPGPPPDGKIIFPVNPGDDCYILDNFGDYRTSSRTHEGVDIMGSQGNAVYAVADGVLTKRYTNTGTAGFGWTLYDEEGERTYKFFHLAEDPNGYEEGDSVKRGDVIGFVGNSGTYGEDNFHLHFEVRLGEGSSTSPINPLPLLDVDEEKCGISPPLRALQADDGDQHDHVHPVIDE